MIDMELKLSEALFGFTRVVTHLDGRKLLLQHTGKTAYGSTRKIKDEGMTDLRSKKKGSLVISFTFILPNITDPILIKYLKQADNVNNINVDDKDLIKTIMTDFVKATKDNNTEEEDDPRRNPHQGPFGQQQGQQVQCAQQ